MPSRAQNANSAASALLTTKDAFELDLNGMDDNEDKYVPVSHRMHVPGTDVLTRFSQHDGDVESHARVPKCVIAPLMGYSGPLTRP